MPVCEDVNTWNILLCMSTPPLQFSVTLSSHQLGATVDSGPTCSILKLSLFISFLFFINYATQSQGIHFTLMHIPDSTFILLVCHSWAILMLLQRSIWILSRWRQSRVPSQLFSRFFPALPLDLKVQEESEHVKINILHSSLGPARHWQWCHSGPPVGLFLSRNIE